jgi:hypothetical protein
VHRQAAAALVGEAPTERNVDIGELSGDRQVDAAALRTGTDQLGAEAFETETATPCDLIFDAVGLRDIDDHRTSLQV